MRVSSQQVFLSGLQSVQKHASAAVEAQLQISSGNKFRLASDNALAAGLGIQAEINSAQFAMYKVNQNHINATMAGTDTQLKSITDMLLRYQQLLTQGANDTQGDEGRQLIGLELESLRGAIYGAANTLDANGESILRQVPAADIRQSLVAPAIALRTNIAYEEVMGIETAGAAFVRRDPSGGDSSSYDANILVNGRVDLEQFLAVSADRLLHGLSPTDEDMAYMEAARRQVTQAQVAAGVISNRLEAASQLAETQELNAELVRSNLLDTDVAEATANLVKANALLQAAQTIMAKLGQNTLFERL